MKTKSYLVALALTGALAASMNAHADAIDSLTGTAEWINAPALRPADLRGKVVLVDFWTYTCVNWLRTLPYVRAWAEKYKDQGLVVVGVHSPEFEFEKNLLNVRMASKALNVNYPVAVDSNHAIWRAYENQYWPAVYILDRSGRVRHRQFGEGDYDRTEKVIQQLLAQKNTALVSVKPQGAEVAADWATLRSEENYLGSERTQNFESASQSHEYALPARLPLNHWALSGNWMMSRDAVMLQKPNGRIAYQFHARDVNLVMGPDKPGHAVRFRVLIDGKSPDAAHGTDVDEQGAGVIHEPRMYQLIRQSKPIVDRLFEIEFLDAGAQAYSFTFG